ncbi:hypothetical protein [Robiginitalea sp.]|uniref:hypothetical protein n=1 Tax=Robiginitalea sp. TaxID=1902411 RepID=UPI003C7762A5
MLRFFRQIRQRLLTDNKFSKYLLYAIGEILLVVIGILLALQINSMYESQENRLKERGYLVQLTDELRSEIQYLKYLKAEFTSDSESLKRITSQWQSGNSIVKDSSQYLIDYSSVGLKNPWYTEPVTWTLLQQTGDLTLIQNNALKNNLFVYYSTLKKGADNYLQYPMEMIKQAREKMDLPFKNDNETFEIILNYSIIYDDSVSVPSRYNEEVFTLIWQNRNNLLSVFIPVMGVSHAQVLLMEGLIFQGETLLKDLEAELAIKSE